MRKRWYRRFLIVMLVLVSVLGTNLSIKKIQEEYINEQVSTGNIANQMVIPGGMPIGIYMKTDGVMVLGTDKIRDASGMEKSPAKHLVKAGDYIVGINGESVESKKDLTGKIALLESEEIILCIRRNGEEIDVKVNAVMAENRKYKLGIWVRDSVQGLGTITFLASDNKFGALGHGIHDSDTDELLEIEEGRVYKASILNIEKGQKGLPGGIEGMIVYTGYNLLGTIDKNTEIGVYGSINNVNALFESQAAVPVCPKNEIKTGKAVIRCCVTDEVKEYQIEIEKIDWFSKEANKGMVIKVTDKELLKLTGGIVQGMSGSPILQDEKIVGAVTHVFVNDPTRGYGIFIEDMLKQ